jgi:RHS repeat-associated protein
MKFMPSKILAALLLATLPLGAVNPPGTTCSTGCKPCCEGETEGTGSASAKPPSQESLSWGISLGLARYPKPTTLTSFGQGAYEPNGNLTIFSELYGRYFSPSPMQQRQVHLELFQSKISAALFHPSCLFMQSEAVLTSLKKPAAGGFPEYIHQVLTDDTFTLIETLTTPESGWRLRVWKRDAAPLNLSGGFYVTTGFNAVTPLTDVTFRRPTGSNANDTLIYIQKENTGVSGSRTITNEITQSLDTNGNRATVTSKLFAGEGTSGDLLSQENLTYTERGAKVWDYTILRDTLTSSVSASGAIGALTLTSKTREVYRDFSTTAIGGELGMKRLISKTEAFDIAGQTPQTTSHTYIDTPANPTTHGRLESTLRPDGSWTFSEYVISPSSPVSIITEYSGWKDLTSDQRENALKTVTTVSANDTLTEVTLAGTLISKSKITLGEIGGSPVTTSEEWDGSAWHTTTTAYFPDTATAPSTGRIQWIEKSDGTATTYSYAIVGGNLTVTQRTGAGTRTAITAGTEVTTTHNLGNHAISQSTRDIASNLEIARWDTDLSYNGGFDALGRPIKRIHNADVTDFDIAQHACCGLEFSRDRSGSTTSYSRDGLKRVYKTVTKASAVSPAISTFTATDGLTTTSTRTYGTSPSQFLGTTTRSIDGLVTTSTAPAQNSTNPADRVTTTRVTTRNPGTGDTVTTTNNFDTATETTTSYLSGQMKSSARTGYATTTYDYTALGETATSGTLTTTQTRDLLGRTLTATAPGSGTTTYTYHPQTAAPGARGKTATVTDADGLTITYGYDSEGEQTTTSRPIPLPGGTTATQVTTTENDVVPNATLHGTALGVSLRTTQTIASTGIAPITTATSYRAITGLLSGSESFGLQTLTTATRTSDTTGIATQTTIAPDGTKTRQTTTHGLLTSASSLRTDHSAIVTQTYTYTTLQQLETTTDSRTGTTTYSDFTESGQARTTATPAGTAANPTVETTTTTLDRHGRPTAVELPDNTITYTSYHLSGLPAGKWGSLTNPTFTLYDDQGRMSELRTYQTLSGEPLAASTGFAKTTWQYSPTTGHLTGKKDHEEKGATYTHTPAGRLASRTWARSSVANPKVTEYTYTQGLMTATDYSDTTPDVSIEYEPLGRIATNSTPVAKTTFTYDANTLALDTETISYNLDGAAGYEFTRVLDRSKDALLRDSGWELKNGTTTENSVRYDYSLTDGRLSSISNPQLSNVSFDFEYETGSSLVKTVTGPAHTVTNTWETNRNILDIKENKAGTTIVSKYDYLVNAIGQRSNVAQSGTAFAGSRDIAWGYDPLGQVTSADSTIPGLDRAYQFDLIGNRLKTADSLTLPVANNYTPNALNQYTAIDTLNPVHDDDGNLTSGPLPANVNANSSLIWDGENRLIQAQVTGGATVNFIYDSQSRRIAETVGTATKITVYDGWNPIAEYWRAGLQPASLAKSFTWGIDLSGTMQGAGGVGGLLAVTDSTGTYYPTYDGNGNVSEYIDSTGAVVAHYEYDPFGKITVATGAKAQDFSHRFSTKPLDITTGLYYYGYRYYDPETGRWPSRDPIAESGGMNLYGFVGNRPINRIDRLGLKWEPLGNGQNHYKATSDSDTLESLALKVSGYKEDWSCLWPVNPQTEISGRYPKVKKCDVYDISNIVKEPSNAKSLAYTLHRAFLSEDQWVESSATYLAANQLATTIRDESGEGATPIKSLYVGSHANEMQTPAILSGDGLEFRLADLVALNQLPTYARAKDKKGPMRCWFSRSSTVRFTSCGSALMAQGFANDVLRKGSKAYGTLHVIAMGQDTAGNPTNTFYDPSGNQIGSPVPHGTGANWASYKGKQ